MTDGPILVADDDPDIRRLVRVVLERDGHRVVSAADGAEALRLALAETPALVVLDLKMPGLSGLEAAAELRKHARLRDVPVVIVTANVSEGTAATSAAAGAACYLRKPFQPDELARPIRELLSRGGRRDADERT